MLEVRVAKKLMVCNRLWCGKLIEKGEKYYWNRLMQRSTCKAHRPPVSEIRRRK
jgi:hypothetical protein